MSIRETEESSRLLREAIEELESPKGFVAPAIRKIYRAAKLVKSAGLERWCRIQLGDTTLTKPIEDFCAAIISAQSGTKKDAEVHQQAFVKLLQEGIRYGEDFSHEEFTVKSEKSGGGWQNAEFIEETYSYLSKGKRGNDGTYYIRNLAKTISFVRREAHSRAVVLFHKLEFSSSASTVFDVLKDVVDDKLLSIAPEFGEKLMVAFDSVSASKTKENWSQALTTCRRLIEDLADKIYPPREESVNGRKLGKSQYINRLWAFMDERIASESNRALAKAQVDLVGKYLESAHDLTNKGVHTEVTRLEAIRTVLHTYLVADRQCMSDTLPTEHA